MNNREMDREIAEKVMGWTLNNYETSEECPEDWTPKKAQNNDGWEWLGGDGNEAHEWCPTEKPEHSKLLREKLAEKGCWTMHAPDENCEHFYFRLRSRGCAVKGYEAEADTEELAVALCALKAVGVEVKP